MFARIARNLFLYTLILAMFKMSHSDVEFGDIY